MLDKIFNEEPKGKMVWSKHLITIYHAVLMGLPVNVEELRAAMDDDEGLRPGIRVPLPGWQQRVVALRCHRSGGILRGHGNVEPGGCGHTTSDLPRHRLWPQQ